MSDVEKLKEEIKKTEQILAESMKNLEENPEEYSAQLLVMSTENHLSDLLKKLDIIMMQQNLNE